MGALATGARLGLSSRGGGAEPCGRTRPPEPHSGAGADRQQPETTVLLTIDQAEELFGYSPPEAATRFLRLLRAGLKRRIGG